METEVWKDIPWYEWLYQASTLGRIKSFHRKWRIMKWWNSTSWYRLVNLSKWITQSTIDIHRLVAIAFIPNTENKREVNHINWIKYDNRVENLEWCTRSENLYHCYKQWLRTPPMKWKFWKYHHLSRKIIQYTKEWKLIRYWDSIKMASDSLNIPESSIWKYCRWIWKNAGWFTWEYNNNK